MSKSRRWFGLLYRVIVKAEKSGFRQRELVKMDEDMQL